MRNLLRVYVCSPLRGDYQGNIRKARDYSKFVAMQNQIPITPHIYFTQFLDDAVQQERDLGIKMGLELLDECDLMYVFGKQITEGMKLEMDYWKNTKHSKPVHYKKFNHKKMMPV